MRKTLFFFSTILICSIVWSQQIVTGKITDATDGTPVAGASVTVANTTIGATSDLSGYYSLTVPVMGSFEIVVSHAGYQPVFYRIETQQNNHQYNVTLEIHELEEIVVGAAKTYSNSDVTLFWQKILGERPSRNGMQVLNAEKVYFYKRGQILKASCREPIEIINHHTGYHIRYMLQSFQHDYTGNETEFYGMPFFEELVPQNSRQQNRWEKKRQEVYAVSLNHFLRAFYNSQIHEAGFFVIDPFVFENVYQPPPSDNIPSGQTGIPQSPVESKKNDERALARQEFVEKVRTEYQRRNQISYLLSDYRRMFETTPSAMLEMVSNHVISSLRQKNTVLSEQHAVQVNIADSLILICISKPAADLKGRTASYPVMVGMPPQQLTIFSDGSYTGMLKMQEFRGNSISLSALSSALPVEYATKVSAPLAKEVAFDENKYLLGDIAQYFDKQLSVYPQEKIHLHSDRDYYVPGERIWFKAYVIDARTHVATTQSRYVYVELISPVDTLINRVMIRPTDDDQYYGHFFLSEIIPEGNYTLRAYTRYMENMGDDYFFKKNIRIENLATPVNQQRPTANRGLLKDNFSVSFFPEGGNLVEGAFCRVAFKAININGYPEAISGKLIDEAGVEIASTETFFAGMGVFEYTPQAGKRFFLKCKNRGGLEKQFELPLPDPRACALTVIQNNNRIAVGVRISPQSRSNSNSPYYLLAHCRGKVLYYSETDRDEVLFDTEDLPAGSSILCYLTNG